jgi:hypothetical protein
MTPAFVLRYRHVNALGVTDMAAHSALAPALIFDHRVRHSEVMTDDKDALLASLNAQREHILGILDGLSAQELRRPVLPTGWTCLGLVHHLAVDVERFWFRMAVAGEQVELDPNGWQVPAGMSDAAVFDLYQDEITQADAIIAATPLDAMPKHWPAEIFPHFPARPLLRTVLHVITETAAHAGHLDAARELIDGKTWLILG